MKKMLLFLLVCCAFSQLKAISVTVNCASFHQENQSYVEVSLNINPNQLTYRKSPDSLHLQATLEVTYIFKQGDKIITADKFNLQGPIQRIPSSFFDIKRYALSNGKYTLEAQVKDIYQFANNHTENINFEINFNNNSLLQSDIQLLKSVQKDTLQSAYGKNGLLMEPLAGNFYDKNTSMLYVYNEIYNSTTLPDAFVLSYAIYSGDVHAANIPKAIAHKKFRPTATPISFLGQFDITKLPSGNYKLVIELRNRAQELLSQKSIDFQRANPYLNVALVGVSAEAIQQEFVANMTTDELKYALRAIACKMRGEESKDLNEIIRAADSQAMKLRLFRYWAAKNPNQPQKAYEDYMIVARAVDQKYRSGFGYGFETDRGYVFMKYGRPDDVVEQVSNPDTAPYEIWVYNDFAITQQRNVKFIFYDAEGSGSMRLLNSNARGELEDPNWRTKLYKNVRNQWDGNGFDSPTGIQDNFNRNADKLLQDF